MDEILELKQCLMNEQYTDAMRIVEEMEEMSKEDKINKIGSFIKILLIHMIKQFAEKRTTRSWDASIFDAIFEIQRMNKRISCFSKNRNPFMCAFKMINEAL